MWKLLQLLDLDFKFLKFGFCIRLLYTSKHVQIPNYLFISWCRKSESLGAQVLKHSLLRFTYKQAHGLLCYTYWRHAFPSPHKKTPHKCMRLWIFLSPHFTPENQQKVGGTFFRPVTTEMLRCVCQREKDGSFEAGSQGLAFKCATEAWEDKL